MQIKKDYTREQIVEIAKRVFLKKSYAKTSMRDIAKGADIGVSNIYNYFKSKDELFCHIVAPLTYKLGQMMHDHHNVNDQDRFVRYARGESDDMLADNVKEYMLLINNHRDELKLLLYQSQGSSLDRSQEREGFEGSHCFVSHCHTTDGHRLHLGYVLADGSGLCHYPSYGSTCHGRLWRIVDKPFGS